MGLLMLPAAHPVLTKLYYNRHSDASRWAGSDARHHWKAGPFVVRSDGTQHAASTSRAAVKRIPCTHVAVAPGAEQ